MKPIEQNRKEETPGSTRKHQQFWPRAARGVLRGFLFGAFLAMSSEIEAQYSLKSSSLSAIGGTSAGGQYAVRSAVGQVGAGLTISGGNFSATGSPWHVTVVSTPGAPLLKIATENGLIRLAWPSSATGFNLQQTDAVQTDPAATVWVGVNLTVSDNGTEKSVSIAPGALKKFYRLKSSP